MNLIVKLSMMFGGDKIRINGALIREIKLDSRGDWSFDVAKTTLDSCNLRNNSHEHDHLTHIAISFSFF